MFLLAAIYLSTRTQNLPQGDVSAAEPHPTRQNRSGIPPEARGISGKSPRHRSQGSYSKSPETVRIEKRLEDSSKDSQASEHLLCELMNSFALDQTNSVRIFEEICHTPPEMGYGPYFGTIAGHAGRWMSYDKALAVLPKGPAFEDIEVQNSFYGLIGAWIFRDAESCKAFMDSLPEGPGKNKHLAAFAVGMAGHGKPEEAESVLTGLPPDSKEVRDARERIKRSGFINDQTR